MDPTIACATRPVDTTTHSNWIVAGLFLDALSRRDFSAMDSCVEPDVRLRALVPSGPLQADGAPEVIKTFRSWFEDAEQVDVVDASIGQVGTRLYLRWSLRLRESDDPTAARLVEHHVFATARGRIQSIDLLSSGHQVETNAIPRAAR